MTTVRDIAEPIAGICVPVPPAGTDICRYCHNHPTPGFPECYSCSRVIPQLTRPARLVVPVSLYAIPSQLHRLLRGYKDHPSAGLRSEFALRVVGILCHFLGRHRDCITEAARGDWEVLTTVPSSGRRRGEHPLVTALRRVPSVFETYEELLERSNVPLDHNKASDEGYSLTQDVRGRRVLLVDDTFTSGARAHSAASAINNAGGTVVAMVPIGRVIDPSYGPTNEWWENQRRLPFTFERCCLEAP